MPIRNLFVIALTTIIALTCYTKASKNKFANLFAEALTTIEQNALQDLPRDQLFESAMNGMTSRLDGHSKYISGEMFRMFNEDLEQQFGGVGMYVEDDPETGQLTVLAPIPGAPAFKAGIRSGDRLVKISGKPTDGIDRRAAVELIRGPKGTTVDVTIARGDDQSVYSLERDFIHEPSLHGDFRNDDGSWNYHLKDYPNIGYLRLLQFGSKSSDEMRDALTEINDEVDSLIIDLRNNTGGLLEGAIEICDLLLPPKKQIVSIRGRNQSLLEEHFSKYQPKFDSDKPLVILINRDSASASEIVSACLQDHQRAVLIGETSWGKGTVQHVIPIERGRSALKLTTASYWRPSGVNIDRYDEHARKSGDWGVKPDEGMALELTEEKIFKNRQLRSFHDLRGLLDAEELSNRDEDKILEIVDEPLQKAIEFLKKQEEGRIAA